MKLSHVYVLASAFAVSAFAAETKISVNDLPSAVQAAMKDQAKGATVLGASKEREHGRLLYEVETSLNGKGRDLTFTEDGKLQELEEEVDLESIPGPAQEAIRKAAAGATIKKVETITEGSTTSYEAAITTKAGKKKEVAVNADGSPHKED